ncbi:EamA family transporter RarD [Anoxynatronum buryatiense]|uniref:Chloramphenicol-sensitive protein RarD n=1 Tax=Anoxynatronum buryatiense TaxID=489973 RepID=A0AA45WU44_9CLOT|nr:EamA family transporter RarD [Anoxynatronum buryatiense]SMP44763.1 chloramphenicol-sensitive protein RarD [Anoxynatronum buryatiense]
MSTESSTSSTTSAVRGIYYALAAFMLWGFLPLYWKTLQSFSAGVILANRIIWSAIFVFFLLKKRNQMETVKSVIRDKKQLFRVFLSAVVISGNWFVYIWAVNANHVIEASMGYYINPLIVILMGMLILKEKLNPMEGAAIILAFAGVLFITWQYGQVPWISLFLATSFSLYGLCKKMVQVDSLVALGLETLILAPVALIYLAVNLNTFMATLQTVSWVTVVLLILSGVLTALPLLWFAQAAKLITMSVLGFSQYLSPSISLLLGIFLFREPFSTTHAISFALIWSGLLIFSLAQTRKRRQPK